MEKQKHKSWQVLFLMSDYNLNILFNTLTPVFSPSLPIPAGPGALRVERGEESEVHRSHDPRVLECGSHYQDLWPGYLQDGQVRFLFFIVLFVNIICYMLKIILCPRLSHGTYILSSCLPFICSILTHTISQEFTWAVLFVSFIMYCNRSYKVCTVANIMISNVTGRKPLLAINQEVIC